MSSKEFSGFLKMKRELNKSALEDKKHQLREGILDAKLEAFDQNRSKYSELETRKFETKLRLQDIKVRAAELELAILEARLAKEQGGTQETEPAN